MDGMTICVILACASSTAFLNCGLRHHADPLAAAFIVAIGGAVVALPALFLTGLPSWESAPYLAVSTLLGGTYWVFLGRAYESGEVGIVYPLAYGSAPIWILILSSFVFQDDLPSSQLSVILLISLGLLVVLFSSAESITTLNRKMVLNSIAVTALICAYTLCDALAVRQSGDPFAYTVFLYLSSGLVVLAYAFLNHRQRLRNAFQLNRYAGLMWGSLSLVNYCGELWAMTRAPVALVAALRETSILFAIIIAIFWLKEPMHRGRIAGASVVAFGLVLMRLS